MRAGAPHAVHHYHQPYPPFYQGVVPHRSAAETDAAYARRTRGATTTTATTTTTAGGTTTHTNNNTAAGAEKENPHHQHEGVEQLLRQAEAQVRTDLERKRVAQQCRDARMYADLAGDLRALESRQSEETLEIMEEFRLLREGQAAARRATEGLARELEAMTLEVAKCHAKTDRVTSLLETLLQRLSALPKP
jgi:hypothetical protein